MDFSNFETRLSSNFRTALYIFPSRSLVLKNEKCFNFLMESLAKNRCLRSFVNDEKGQYARVKDNQKYQKTERRHLKKTNREASYLCTHLSFRMFPCAISSLVPSIVTNIIAPPILYKSTITNKKMCVNHRLLQELTCAEIRNTDISTSHLDANIQQEHTREII